MYTRQIASQQARQMVTAMTNAMNLFLIQRQRQRPEIVLYSFSACRYFCLSSVLRTHGHRGRDKQVYAPDKCKLMYTFARPHRVRYRSRTNDGCLRRRHWRSKGTHGRISPHNTETCARTLREEPGLFCRVAGWLVDFFIGVVMNRPMA